MIVEIPEGAFALIVDGSGEERVVAEVYSNFSSLDPENRVFCECIGKGLSVLLRDHLEKVLGASLGFDEEDPEDGDGGHGCKWTPSREFGLAEMQPQGAC